MTAAYLFPFPKFRAFTIPGKPLVGGKLYTYASGTSNPLPTYTDYTGGTPNTNPVILDAAGEADVWIPAGVAYRMTLMTADNVELWSEDGIVSAPPAPSAGDIDYQYPGLYSVERTVKLKLDEWASILDFGGSGDGATNNVAAITSLNARNLSWVLPMGTDGGVYYVATSITINNNCDIRPGAKFKIASGATLTFAAPITAGNYQIFDLSLGGTVVCQKNSEVYVRWFGAVGNGVTDDGPIISKAIDVAMASNRANLVFGAGVFAIATTISKTTDNYAITMIGNPMQSPQTGSVLPNCTLRWTGTSGNMFTMSGSYWAMDGFSVENYGSADNFWFWTLGQWGRFRNLFFLLGNTATPFADSIFKATTNNFGYSVFEGIDCASGADYFLYLANLSAGNGVTPIIFNNCNFETNAATAMTVIKLVDTTIDAILMNQCKFNQQSAVNELCILDTLDGGNNPCVYQFALRDIELDSNSSNAAHRFGKWYAVKNISMTNINNYSGGSMAYAFDLTYSQVTEFDSSYYQSVPYIFNPDANSTINIGANFLATSVAGYFPGNSTSCGVHELAQATNVDLTGRTFPVNVHGIFRVNVTTDDAWNLRADAYFTRGQIISVQIFNSGAAAPATPTTSTDFSTAGSLVAPANGNNRTYTFLFDGTNFQEISRTAADVSNS